VGIMGKIGKRALLKKWKNDAHPFCDFNTLTLYKDDVTD
jgi:hypothetical protein